MTYDPVLKIALSGPVINFFFAVEIMHPVVGPIRLLDGDGFLTLNGHQFVGRQAGVGMLGPVGTGSDGEGDEAPSLTIAILPENAVVATDLCVPQAQGAAVTFYAGAFDPQTGMVVGLPYVWFIGEVDVPNLPVDDSGGVTFDCVSGFERFFDTEEGMTLSDAFHQSVFAGELGLQYVTDIELQMPWGQDGVRPAIKRAGISS